MVSNTSNTMRVPGRSANCPRRGHHLIGGSDVDERRCSVGDCDHLLLAKGLCNLHYHRLRNSGRLTLPTTEERFWSHVDKAALGGCWLWTGATHEFGYGQFRSRTSNTPHKAHRAAWEYVVGPIPPGMSVLHRCDVPPCVNPAHLFLGTQMDNIHDMISKGRRRAGNPVRGDAHPRAKLTNAQAAEVRRLVNAGVPRAEVAKRFDIAQSTLQGIVSGKTYAVSTGGGPDPQ